MFGTVKDTIDSINDLAHDCDVLTEYLVGNNLPTGITFHNNSARFLVVPTEDVVRKVIEVILHEYVNRLTDMKDELRHLLLDAAESITDELCSLAEEPSHDND